MALEIEKASIALVHRVLGGEILPGRIPSLDRPGKRECGRHWLLMSRIYAALTGGDLPDVMPPREYRRFDLVLRHGGGQRLVEIDEDQHFNVHRATTLRLYPSDIRVAFDPAAWLDRCRTHNALPGGGFARATPPLFPGAGGRHRQRAFRDALCDILAVEHGFLPTLRIGKFEVKPWLAASDAVERMADLLDRKLAGSI